MKVKTLGFLVLGAFLAAGLSCLMPAPQPTDEPPAPTPAPGTSLGREAPAPERFTLNFKEAYLVYDPQTGVLQIAAEGNVLSYGGDWEVRKIHSYLFHFRLRTWREFYWQVNTSRLEVIEVRGGTFGSVMGGADQRMPFRVEKKGGAGAATPQSIKIVFPKSHMVYSPGNDVFQLITEGQVLSYCGDWQRCRLRNNVYHFKQGNWERFIWSVNTLNKRVWRVRNVGGVCQSGGSEELLDIKVGVTR